MRMPLFLIFCFAVIPQAALAQVVEQSAASEPDVCRFIASAEPGFYGDHLRDFTQRQGWVDANNDGAVEYAALVADGSAHVTGITLLQDGYPLPELSMRYEADKEEFFLRGWGLRDQQWLNYQGTTYLLNMLGGSDRLVRYAWHFTPDYSGEKVCEFDIHPHVSSARPTSQAIGHFKQGGGMSEEELTGLCRKVAQQEAEGYRPPQPMDVRNISPEIRSESFVMADIDNDGQEEKLLRIHYASGAGVGCDGTFLLRDGDTPLLSIKTTKEPNAMKQRLYDVQHVDFTGRHLNCDRSADPRLLVYAGRTFLERGDLATPLRDAKELYHELWYFKGEAAIPVCRFDIQPEMKLVFP